MCGRYTLRTKPESSDFPSWLEYWQDVHLPEARYNIGPHPFKPAPIIYQQGCEDMLFGMKPHWAKSTLINAKSEGLKNSKFWRPLAAMKPCLVPADGFYEPQKKQNNKKRKYPWFGFELENQQPFFMAGLWKAFEGQKHFVVLTREPDSTVGEIHDRMPVIFTEQESERASLWMNTEMGFGERLKDVAQAKEYQTLKAFPVSDDAKNLGNEGPSLFLPI